MAIKSTLSFFLIIKNYALDILHTYSQGYSMQHTVYQRVGIGNLIETLIFRPQSHFSLLGLIMLRFFLAFFLPSSSLAESATKKQQELHRGKSLFNVCFHLSVAVSASRCCLSPRLINFNSNEEKSLFSCDIIYFIYPPIVKRSSRLESFSF